MLARAIRPQLAEQYTDMLAKMYRSRRMLLSSYRHTLRDLVWCDRQILTHLEGMMSLKEQSSVYLRGQIQEPLSPGELFSVALFAAGTDDEFLLSGCMGLAQALPRLLPVLFSVVDRMPEQSGLWPQMMSLPTCRAYIAATRNDRAASVVFSQRDLLALIEQGRCIDFLLYFLCRNASPLFVPALETVFSSGREELILQGCRAVLCSRPQADNYTRTAISHLLLLAHSKNEDIRLAAVRHLLTHQAVTPRDFVRDLTEEDTDIRLLIKAMGWSGLPEYIPALVAYFDEPEYARLSALSVISVTGSLPERDGWQCNKEKDVHRTVDSESADIPETDPEEGVSWPERAAFEQWWRVHQGDFAPDMPYLCGQLTTPEGLETVLKQGYLNLWPLAFMRMGQFSERADRPAINQSLFLCPATKYP
ncbi:hypothetical protein [Huaxiibacter chinensis]|uniref:hypothetical protein n=1 Tax=Huaxiibacter chinensis TaxID=2899785 RepID=UPI003D3122CB